MKGEVTRAACQSFDSELGRRIPSLGTKHNELAPISILPPEILSTIFVLVRDLLPHGPSIGSRCSNHLAPWINVGHICRHWREIALDCPNLWSIPVFARPELAQEMIERSKTAPLTIKWTTDARSSQTQEQLENALAQTTRIRSIDLAFERYTQKLERIFSLLSQPAPILENLSVGFDSTNGYRTSFPQDALSNAPRLRSISLRGLIFSWKSAIFKHTALTELRLTNSPGGASTMGQMMDALHNLPNLRFLALRNSLPPYVASDGNMRIVEFNFLERLELAVKTADCVSFLRHIQYPSSTTVKLHSFLTSVEDGVTTISLLGQSLCRVPSIQAGVHHTPVVIRSARLTSNLNVIGIALYNGFDNMIDLYAKGGLDPVIHVYFRGDPIPFRGDPIPLLRAQGPLLMSISNSFDLSSLEGLLLHWNFGSDHIHAIQNSFGKLPKLKVINVPLSLPEVCIALAGTGGDEKTKNNNSTHEPPQNHGINQHSSSTIILFPALETLMIQCVDFKQRQQQHPEIIHCLVDMLIERSNINKPIDNLSLKCCHGVRTWQARLLGGLVIQLEVDGKVIDVGQLEYGWSDGDDHSEEDKDEDENEPQDGGRLKLSSRS